jgi:hypothetical protein
MSAYQAMIDVLADVAERPEASALEILKALREVPAEVAQAGVDPLEWSRACDAMIAAAIEVDGVRRASDAANRETEWPAMKARLEQNRCGVTDQGEGRWRVSGTGLSIDIDLSTGAVEHSDGQLGEQLPEFERLEEFIIRSVASREAHRADMARRKERRKTHRWDNSKKAWMPKTNFGTAIKGGG